MQVNRLPRKRLEFQIKQWQFQSVNLQCRHRVALPPEILCIYRILLGKPRSAGERTPEQTVTETLTGYCYKHFRDSYRLPLSTPLCEIICYSPYTSGYWVP